MHRFVLHGQNIPGPVVLKNDSLSVFLPNSGHPGEILVGLSHRNDSIGISMQVITLLFPLYTEKAINQPIIYGSKAKQ